MRLLLVVSVAALVSTGCALRPRYADFATDKTAGKELSFLITDPTTQMPVAGAKIEVSELRNKLTATSAADGTFKFPMDKKYVEENAVFVVTLPKGVTEYRLSLAPAPVEVVPVAPPAPVEPPAAPVESAPDAGVIDANG